MKESEDRDLVTDGEAAEDGERNELGILKNSIDDDDAMNSMGELDTELEGLGGTESGVVSGISEDQFENLSQDPEPVIEPPVKESKARAFFRGFLRWTAGLLIIFGLGLITGIYAFYRPALGEAEQMGNQLLAEIQTANDKNLELESQITTLNSKIADLQPYKDKNEELLDQTISLELHVAILDARLDVANALAAIVQNDVAQAKVILDKTYTNLEKISLLLEDDQKEVVTNLMTRLDWVFDDVGIDPETAISDLTIIGAKLLQIEDSLLRR